MPTPTVNNTPHPRGQGFAVAIDDTLFRPAFGPGRELQIETAELQGPSIDTRQNPEEMTEGYGQTFARDDFTGGEGLDRAHTRDQRVNQASRYYDSRNIEVRKPEPGETREIRLLHSTELFSGFNSAVVRMAGGGSYRIAATNGTQVRSLNPVNGTFVDENPHGAEAATTVEDVAVGTDGTVYAALGANGVHQQSFFTGVWSHYSNVLAKRVWVVKNRLFASDGQSLYEVTAGGAAPTPLYTLPAETSWADVVDADAAILAAAGDGYIYAFAPSATGALELKAQTRIQGESPTALGVAQGVVFYGTAQGAGSSASNGVIGRLWRATLSDGFTLVGGQLIREWRPNGNLNRSPRRIIALRDSVYTAIVDSATETHAWRYDLASQAVSRSFVFNASGVCHGLIHTDGRLFAGISGSGVHRETNTYASEGWLVGPLGDFFTSSIKSWVGARFDAGNVSGGAQVDLLYTTDPTALTNNASESWVRVKTTTSGADDAETAMAGVTARSLAGQVRLFASADRTSSPTVRSFSFRAYPGGGGNVDKVISIPLNVSDQLESPNRKARAVRGWGQRVYDTLRGFEGQAVRLRLFRPEMTLRGLVESVGAPIPAVSERGSPTLYALVKFRGRETEAASVAGGAMGVGGMGVTGMGT